jgi:hypothetical protein
VYIGFSCHQLAIPVSTDAFRAGRRPLHETKRNRRAKYPRQKAALLSRICSYIQQKMC